MWSSMFTAELGGYDQSRFQIPLEVVNMESIDGRHTWYWCVQGGEDHRTQRGTRCWDSINQLVYSQLWVYDRVTLALSYDGERANGSQFVRCHEGSGSYIQESTCNHQNTGKTVNLGWMLHLVYTVRGVCCTQCQLTIIAWSNRVERLYLLFCSDGRVVYEKKRCRMKNRKIRNILLQMRNQGYDLLHLM